MSYLDKQQLRNFRPPELTLVHYSLQKHISNHGPLLKQMSQYILAMGGKRIRPTLVLLSANIYKASLNTKVQLAAAAEMIHTASLLHDDVVDKATVRRNQPTANQLWGNAASVLTGDFLFARAFQILSRFPDVLNIFTRAIASMCQGELHQLHGHNNRNMDVHAYLTTIAGKTGSLISACCQAGAMISTMPPNEQKQVARYGLWLGTAYQVIDDICDYTLTQEKSGKASGIDLSQGIITLPLIYWFQGLNSDPDPLLLQPQGFRALVGELRASGALSRARADADALLDQAVEQMSGLPKNDATKRLVSLAQFLKEQCQDTD